MLPLNPPTTKPPRVHFLSHPPLLSSAVLLHLRSCSPTTLLSLHRQITVNSTSRIKRLAKSTAESVSGTNSTAESDSGTKSTAESDSGTKSTAESVSGTKSKAESDSGTKSKPLIDSSVQSEEDQISEDESSSESDGVVDFEVVGGENGDKMGENLTVRVPRTSVSSSSSSDLLSLGIPEPVYKVVEVKSDGKISTNQINRRQLLKSSGLRPRDIRSVDPSLWLTNSMPSLLVREHAILLNLGSLRAIVMQERVLIFNYNRRGGKAFIDSLLPRLSPENTNGGMSMPFVLEVVEAALLSRIQRLEKRMMELEPRVQSLLEVLPNRLTGDILEQLRTSKQTLVELCSRADALRQMLLDLLEDTLEIRRICIMGRNCSLSRITNSLECSVPSEKEIAEEEEEEIEMLLENYLQRCESLHGQAERLLDSAKEMEDSIAVNLSSRRLEVSKVELLLQVGTFCVAIGALIAGIFGMNLRSYLEEHVYAFWLTTAGIMVGIVMGFFLMYFYLKKRKIL